MRKAFRVWTGAASLLAAGTLAASAAVIDFTDNSIYSSRTGSIATGSVDGIGFTVTGRVNRLTFASDGPGAIGGLAGENDGIGLVDDEIGGVDYITVMFDREVELTGVSFLDFFGSGDGDAEEASVYAGATPTDFIASFQATQLVGGGRPGFGTFGLSATGTTFTFSTDTGNDGRGSGDFSLAALEVAEQSAPEPAPVPLPAGVVLLGSALVGFRTLRRRSA